jgi:hypothetical protein
MAKADRMSTWRLRIVLLSIGCVAGLTSVEIALRILHVNYASFYVWDGRRGFYAHRPGAEGWFTREGRAYIQIDSDGLRSDRSHSRNKPPGTIRIAVLGDSYAEAFQLAAEDAFWAVLARELSTCDALGEPAIEAVNFGVSGYGTAQEWLTLQRHAWLYDPDIVLLAFSPGNDLRNNSPILNGDAAVPYFSLAGDGSLVASMPHEPLSGRVRSLFGPTAYDFVFNNARSLQVLLRFRASQAAAKQAESSGGGTEIGLDDYAFSSPTDPNWVDAWGVTEAMISAMQREITARGKILFLAVLSTGIQVNPDPDVREAFKRGLGVDDLYYADRRLVELGARNGFPAAMLAPEMLRWAESNARCVHGFQNGTPCGGHWNQDGHRIAGEILAREMCRNTDTVNQLRRLPNRAAAAVVVRAADAHVSPR